MLFVCFISAAHSYGGSGSGSGLMLSGMEPVIALRGEPVLLPCQTSSAYPPSRVDWYQNGTQVGSDDSGVEVYTHIHTCAHIHTYTRTHTYKYIFIRGRYHVLLTHIHVHQVSHTGQWQPA